MTSATALVAALALTLAAACQTDPHYGVVSSALFDVSPTDHAFADTLVGEGSSSITVIVTSPSGEDEMVDVQADCPGFGVDISAVTLPQLVTAAEPLSFPVTFLPDLPGLQNCIVNLIGDQTSSIVTFTGTGLAQPVDLNVIDPTGDILDFGEVIANTTSAPLTITARNDGSEDVFVTPSVETGTIFQLVDSSAGTIPAGMQHSWQVTCRPLDDQPQNDTFLLASGDPVSVALTCRGIDTALQLDPAPMLLPDELVGDITAPIDLTITNNLGGEITITNITVDNPVFAHGTPGTTTLAPGMTTTVPITFAPDGPGSVDANLTVSHTGGIMRTIRLHGTGRTANLVISPSGEIDLGTICVGTDTSDPVEVTIANSGDGVFDVTDITPAGGGFTTDAGSGTLVPGGTYTFEVGYGPVATAGEETGAMEIHTAIPNDSTHPIPLRASAIASGVGAAPSEHDFGAVATGEASAARTFMVTNCDSAAITISDVAVVGDDADSFALVAGAPVSGVTLDRTEREQWMVRFVPDRAGELAAQLQITYGGGSLVIPVTGTGVGVEVPGGGDGDRGSYLACRAGGAGAGWPLLAGLALLLARRRRRRS